MDILITRYSLPQHLIFCVLLVILFSGYSSASHGQPDLSNTQGTNQSIRITADSAKFDQLAGTVLYQGSVELTHGEIELQADRLLIELNANKISKAIASGQPVNFLQKISSQNLTNAQGQRVIYDTQEGLVVIQGDAKLQQNSNLFSGAEIRYNLSTETVEASGKRSDNNRGDIQNDNPERIKMVIQTPVNQTEVGSDRTTNAPEEIQP